jgi:hypothetical protein
VGTALCAFAHPTLLRGWQNSGAKKRAARTGDLIPEAHLLVCDDLAKLSHSNAASESPK